MKNNNSWMKWAALGCCVLYLLLFLVLPFIAVRGIGILGVNGADLMSSTFWAFLPLFAGIAMGVCTMVASDKTAGAVCICGAVIPLITFFIVRGSVINGALSLAGLSGGGIGGYLGNKVFTIGAGAILPILLGAAAAVFCFLSGNAHRPVERTAGLGAGQDDDW